mmetsp:Transcript_31313/g.43416  ORF Transcript_31313/g.43416 Transcript_31313/m.43416 type:complete len:204 (+) Transcript_31313:271-882(+)
MEQFVDNTPGQVFHCSNLLLCQTLNTSKLLYCFLHFFGTNLFSFCSQPFDGGHCFKRIPPGFKRCLFLLKHRSCLLGSLLSRPLILSHNLLQIINIVHMRALNFIHIRAHVTRHRDIKQAPYSSNLIRSLCHGLQMVLLQDECLRSGGHKDHVRLLTGGQQLIHQANLHIHLREVSLKLFSTGQGPIENFHVQAIFGCQMLDQ